MNRIKYGSIGDSYFYDEIVVLHPEKTSDPPVAISFKFADDKRNAKEMDIFVWMYLICELEGPSVTQLTLEGGDPFDNLRLANDIALLAKDVKPSLKIALKTKRRYEEIVADNIMRGLLEKCDILNDGRIIDVKKSLKAGKPSPASFVSVKVR